MATTTCTSAMPPLVMKHLVPSMIQSSPSRRARVRRLPTSLPELGSVMAKAPSLMSSGVPKQRGIHSIICSGVAAAKMPAQASWEPKMESPIPASPQKISSLTSGMVRPLSSP